MLHILYFPFSSVFFYFIPFRSGTHVTLPVTAGVLSALLFGDSYGIWPSHGVQVEKRNIFSEARCWKDENVLGQSVRGCSKVRWQEFHSNISIFSLEQKVILWLMVKSWESKLKRDHNILEELPQGTWRRLIRDKGSDDKESSSPQTNLACINLQYGQNVTSGWMLIKLPLGCQCWTMPKY